MKECGLLADAGGLLHRVGDDHDRIFPAQFVDQFLDLSRCDRVERRAGFVHQEHLGRGGHGPGDAEPLLLAAGKAGAGLIEPVLGLVPEGGAAQGLLDDGVEIGPCACQAVNTGTVGHVVIDRLGKGVGFLEHHADLGAQLHRVDGFVVDVMPVEPDVAGHAADVDGVVHPV